MDLKDEENQHSQPSAPMPHIVIVSGLSGSGKTVALRAFEDIGYFCVDNLPVILIENFLDAIRTDESIKGIAIGVDIREKEFLIDSYQILSRLKKERRIEILFLEAEKDVLIRRYKETRRPHPMLLAGTDIDNAIELERSILSSIRESSDKIIDTSTYTPHQLRHLIMSTYGNSRMMQDINISIISFGYKFGLPQNLDLLFDVRFLPNPHFIPELKPFKGTDPIVSDFVLDKEDTKKFLAHIFNLFDFLIPRYIEEGKTYLVIGIGCTGGVHRSPAIVERISSYIQSKHGIKPIVIHRDMG